MANPLTSHASLDHTTSTGNEDRSLSDSLPHEGSGIISGLYDALLPLFAFCLSTSRNAQQILKSETHRLNRPQPPDTIRDRPNITSPDRESSQDVQESTSVLTHVDILVSILSRIVLWGDIVEDGIAEATSVDAPDLFESSVRLLTACGEDGLKLAALMSKVYHQPELDKTKTNTMEIWLDKAHYMLDQEPDRQTYSSDTADVSIDLVLRALDDTVSLLMALLTSMQRVRISKTLDIPAAPGAEFAFIISQPSRSYIDQIAAKYTLATSAIVERLGEANWQRFHRLRVAEDDLHATELAHAQSIFHAPLSSRALEVLAKSTGHPKSFIDSAYGTATDTGIDDTQSIRSDNSLASAFPDDPYHSSRVPPEPAAVSQGLPFICPICDVEVDYIHSRSEWKLHVFRDLMPYICLHDGCTSQLTFFASRGKWSEHDTMHNQVTVFDCQDCSTSAATKSLFEHHLSTAHAGLNANQKTAFLHAAKKVLPDNPTDRVCPLCKQTDFSTIRRYTSHVCRHMEDIALKVLPLSLYDDESASDHSGNESASDHKSQKSQQQGLQSQSQGQTTGPISTQDIGAISGGSPSKNPAQASSVPDPDEFDSDLPGLHQVDLTRVDLKRFHTDPFSPDSYGHTPSDPVPRDVNLFDQSLEDSRFNTSGNISGDALEDTGRLTGSSSRNLYKCEEVVVRNGKSVICGSTYSAKSELQKHKRRHGKRFGCTFDGCYAKFGTKWEWNRHERNQHIQSEAWRCNKVSPTSTCQMLFNDKAAFRKHLIDGHFPAGDFDYIEREVSESHLQRQWMGSYWCGHCRSILTCTKDSAEEMMTERFEHVARHVLEGADSNAWVELGANGANKEDMKALALVTEKDTNNGELDEDSSDDSMVHVRKERDVPRTPWS